MTTISTNRAHETSEAEIHARIEQALPLRDFDAAEVAAWYQTPRGHGLDDIDLPDDSVSAMADAATKVLEGAYLVGAFVPPRYPDANLDWRAELTPRPATTRTPRQVGAFELGQPYDPRYEIRPVGPSHRQM